MHPFYFTLLPKRKTPYQGFRICDHRQKRENQTTLHSIPSSSRKRCIPGRIGYQVYDTWNPTEYERYVDSTFPALKAALQDASSDTRSFGRMAVSTLCRTFPEKGKVFMKSLDFNLKQRLSQNPADNKQGYL